MTTDFTPIVDALIDAATILIPILLGLVVRSLLPYLNNLAAEADARLGSKNMEFLIMVARTFVQAAEQITGLDTGPKKQAYVLELLSEFAETYQIPITPDQLEAIIEGVLREIKTEGPVVVSAISWEDKELEVTG